MGKKTVAYFDDMKKTAEELKSENFLEVKSKTSEESKSKRSYELKLSTIRKLDELKVYIYPPGTKYHSIVDEAICLLYEQKKGNSNE